MELNAWVDLDRCKPAVNTASVLSARPPSSQRYSVQYRPTTQYSLYSSSLPLSTAPSHGCPPVDWQAAVWCVAGTPALVSVCSVSLFAASYCQRRTVQPMRPFCAILPCSTASTWLAYHRPTDRLWLAASVSQPHRSRVQTAAVYRSSLGR